MSPEISWTMLSPANDSVGASRGREPGRREGFGMAGGRVQGGGEPPDRQDTRIAGPAQRESEGPANDNLADGAPIMYCMRELSTLSTMRLPPARDTHPDCT